MRTQTRPPERKGMLRQDVSNEILQEISSVRISFQKFANVDTGTIGSVVTLYLLIVFGLLLGAGIKNRMEKAGFNVALGRTNWWETWMNRRPLESIGLSRFTNSYRREGNLSSGRGYIPVSNPR
ncbi:hypothetical protein E1B28_001087 [Marasmius oreades]|uniref:Uncharacterized protein n=1 Tax=Marasmius oreades TaxID=181124 RepID=A0A9P7V2P2_9AGAR|nr:uncharacterized protein E1B28_001087 [Marasmius oreades]KAG7099220.1 hypothetical protein E1B28_001087 [Marasmius oreades]